MQRLNWDLGKRVDELTAFVRSQHHGAAVSTSAGLQPTASSLSPGPLPSSLSSTITSSAAAAAASSLSSSTSLRPLLRSLSADASDTATASVLDIFKFRPATSTAAVAATAPTVAAEAKPDVSALMPFRSHDSFKVDRSRVFDFGPDCLVVTSSQGKSHGFLRVLLHGRSRDEYVPVHSGLIRDIKCSLPAAASERTIARTLVLTASCDRTLKVTNLGTKCEVACFRLEQQAWSCAWHSQRESRYVPRASV